MSGLAQLTWHDVRSVCRDLKWMIVVSLTISVLLFLPDQIRELYRIAADEIELALWQFLFVLSMAVVIWFGAVLVSTPTLPYLQSSVMPRFMSSLLGALPLFMVAFAQEGSRPTSALAANSPMNLVGSVFRIHQDALRNDVATLNYYFYIMLAAAVAFFFLTYRFGDARLRRHSDQLNAIYFTKLWPLAITFGILAIFTIAVLSNPVAIPQALGSFGIAAVFTFCIVIACIHLSLFSNARQIPVIPFIALWVMIIAYKDWNDNHAIRQTVTSEFAATAAASTPRAASRATAAEAFVDWLKQPGRVKFGAADAVKEYPVFIVSAQGGGMYAAYNAGVFLARIQDQCPSFRQHLFAISAVSGGSVGASVFVSALHAQDQDSGAPEAGLDPADGPCRSIAKFLSQAQPDANMDRQGPVERKVDVALSSDFLAPLLARSLFADFTQSFIPLPIPAFDRARGLELALEDAAGKMYQPPFQKTVSKENLLKQDYQEHWNAERALPALIMSTTDSGSGKRIVISPFDFDASHPTNSDMCMLSNVARSTDASKRVISSSSLNFPLSTAAFMSARFPWVTPAATVDVENACITKMKRARLVDGGYVDNSGVETALNLIEEMKHAADEAARKDPATLKPKIYLISLTGGDFPDRKDWSFNELFEPIRALLSGRESRAYIALNRAQPAVRVTDATSSADLKDFRSATRTDLNNYFYNLPLGWTLSDKTRDIISLASGRFWDCEPDGRFLQARSTLSNADCIQLQVYHLLNNSAVKALEDGRKVLAINRKIGAKPDLFKTAAPKVDHEGLLACYEKEWWQDREKKRWEARVKKAEQDKHKGEALELNSYKQRYLSFYQTEHARELLKEWDRLQETDINALAYILGSVSYDSNDFRRMTENLSFMSERQIRSRWGPRIDSINAENKRLNPAAKDIDVKALVNKPEDLANLVWGSSKNSLGNTEKNDGWNYRQRGIYQIVGRGQYTKNREWIGKPYLNAGVDIVAEPEFVWNRVVSAKVAMATFRNRRSQSRGPHKNMTVFEIMAKNPGDWRAARVAQDDMFNKDKPDDESVADRSAMFHACIVKNMPRAAASSG